MTTQAITSVTAEAPYIQYDYYGKFDFQRFVERVSPLVEKCIVYPDNQYMEGDFIGIMEESPLHTEEIEQMLIRMGFRDLDGKHGFSFEADMTYIEEDVDMGDGVIRFPLDVQGTIALVPHPE